MLNLTNKRIPQQLSCSTVCFRDRSLADALKTIEAMGFQSVDLAALAGLCEHIPPQAETHKLTAASIVLKNSTLRFTSINADTGSFNSDIDNNMIYQRVTKLSRFASEHQIPLIVLTSGEKEQPDDDVVTQIRCVAEGLARCYELGAAYGVEIAVEAPHFFRLVNTPERVNLLDKLLDPRVKFIFDTSHIRAPGQNVSLSYQSFAKRTRLIHLRDAVDGDIRRVIGNGDINFRDFFETAASLGYDGDYVLELETHNSPFATKDEEVSDAVRRLSPLLA